MERTQVRNHEFLGFKSSAGSVELSQRDHWQKLGNDLITAGKGWGGFEGDSKASSCNDKGTFSTERESIGGKNKLWGQAVISVLDMCVWICSLICLPRKY